MRTHNETYNFDYRIKMCDGVHEGTEIEDIVKNLTRTARMLHAFEDHDCQILLVIAERLCQEYVRETLLARQCDWEEYEEACNDEVYTYFSGGAKKFTEEEFENLKRG